METKKMIRQFWVSEKTQRDFAATCKRLGVHQADLLAQLVEAWVKKNSVDRRKGKS